MRRLGRRRDDRIREDLPLTRCDQHEMRLKYQMSSTIPAATFRRSNRTKEPPIGKAVKKPVCIVKAAHHAVGAAAATARAEKRGMMAPTAAR